MLKLMSEKINIEFIIVYSLYYIYCNYNLKITNKI
jgi:hypothetical protein